MKTQVTLDQLASAFGKRVWEKGDLRRIYLNEEGYNTKKMSTKTFIWQNEEGEFSVSCRIDCPSQGLTWIKSQEDVVREWVNKRIDRAIFSIERPDEDYDEVMDAENDGQ